MSAGSWHEATAVATEEAEAEAALVATGTLTDSTYLADEHSEN